MADLQPSDDQLAPVVDEVTGLANRRGFLEMLRMEERRRARYGGAPALLVIDVDRGVGRTGPAERDDVLARIGALLASVTRDTDTLGRVGDHRFALLAIDAGDDVRPIAGRLRLLLEVNGVSATVTAGSAGSLEQAWRELDVPARPNLRLVSE